MNAKQWYQRRVHGDRRKFVYEMNGNPNLVEAQRLVGVAEKLLHGRDLNGSRDFALLAQETDPLLDASDQILAVVDVLLAADRRINNHHHDWYSILQIHRRSDDHDLIKKQYRKLALLLHPDKNHFPFADHAFKLVADAWAVLSDSAKKSSYDNSLFSKVDLGRRKNNNSEDDFSKVDLGRRKNSNSEDDSRLSSFWTACPYCYNLFEYPRVYEGCCLRCQNCKRAFQAVLVPSLPPLVPGQEAYYCCWGFFPLGYVEGSSDGKAAASSGGFPNWMPPMFPNEGPKTAPPIFPNGQEEGPRSTPGASAKKRGRPRKY